MGNLMRRYWHPVATVPDLDKDPVRPIRHLGEDLVLFRSEAGEVGLIADRCAHRAISLAYGIPQANGLRCAYHGWTYNTEGRVVDMPFEPACLPLKIKSYPVHELGGLLWGYLGPDPAPLLPRWELLVKENVDRSIEVTPLPCNWLNAMDNSLDPVHYEHLHGHYGNYVAKKEGREPPMTIVRHAEIAFDVYEYGIYKRRRLENQPVTVDDWTTGHPIIFPNILLVGDARLGIYQIRVPIDDTHTMHYNYNASPRLEGVPKWEGIRVNWTTIYEESGQIVANSIFKQDALGWVGQGPISDRTQEHLATSDKGVILYHNMLLDEIEKVERGEDPKAVIRDPDVNEPFIRIKWEERAKEAYWPGGRNYRNMANPGGRLAGAGAASR
jgi:5,5'-dehydrodivanillate O-demethylase